MSVLQRKLEYLASYFVDDYKRSKYPKFYDFVKVYLRYLDDGIIGKTINLSDNNYYGDIYPEFLDDYLNMYMSGMVDLDKYGLDDANKKIFIQFSRLINNLKGNSKSFDFLFRSFTDIVVARDDIQIPVDKISVSLIENEDWWYWGDGLFCNGAILANGSSTANSTQRRPFTYQFEIDQEKSDMLPLIKAVHPAGMINEFLIALDFEDQISDIEETLSTSTTYYHYASGGLPGYTTYYCDGSIDASGSHTIIETL